MAGKGEIVVKKWGFRGKKQVIGLEKNMSWQPK